MNIDGGDTDEALAVETKIGNYNLLVHWKGINDYVCLLCSVRFVRLPGNTDCAEIEVLLLFCDADPTVIVPIGECGDKLGRAAAGGL